MVTRAKRFYALIVVAAAFAVGCPSNNGDNNGQILDPNNQPNNGETNGGDAGGTAGGDTGAVDPDVGGAADMGGTDPDTGIENPGAMHGTWRVEKAEGGEVIATLMLRHEEGTSSVSGTFEMEGIDPGPTGGGTLNGEDFSISWTADVDGDRQQLGLGCTVVDADNLECTHTSTILGSPVDALMKRQ